MENKKKDNHSLVQKSIGCRHDFAFVSETRDRCARDPIGSDGHHFIEITQTAKLSHLPALF